MSFSVKNPAYAGGAKGDCKTVGDGVTVLGSSILQSPTAGWVIGDVGKTIWAVGVDPINPLVSQTTITGFIDSSHITVAPAVAGYSTPNAKFTWGTDDTAAFVAAYAASRTDAATTVYPSLGSFGQVSMPAGAYLVTSRFYGPTTGGGTPVSAFGLVGESKETTIIFPSPNCPVPSDFTAVWMEIIGGTGELSGFSIQGPDHCYVMLGGDQPLIHIADAQATVDFSVSSVGSTTLIDPAVLVDSSKINGTLLIHNRPEDFAHSTLNLMWAFHAVNSYGVLTDCLFSNLSVNVVLDQCVSRQGVLGDQQLVFVGGLVDDALNPAGAIFAQTGSAFLMIGTVIAAGGNYAFVIDGTSKVWFVGCGLGSYFLGDAVRTKALRIESGGVAIAEGSTFNAVSTVSDVSIDNDGLFMDAGGNDALNGGTGANVAVPWLHAFKNPTQILRR